MVTLSIERATSCSGRCSDCKRNEQEDYLCLTSEAEFLSSLLRLQQRNLLKSLGYDQGQLVEWYQYAKRSFHSHPTTSSFLWGLKLLDELAKLVFDAGQLTAKMPAGTSMPLITAQEQALLEAWISNDKYKEKVKKVETISKSVVAGAKIPLDAAAYSMNHEVRVGFTKIRQVGTFHWIEHNADVYVAQWSDNAAFSDSEQEHCRICLALAYLDGVSRFGVGTKHAQIEPNGYVLGNARSSM